MRVHHAVSRVTLRAADGTRTHAIEGEWADKLLYATLRRLDATEAPRVVFVCSRQSDFQTLSRAYLLDVVAGDRTEQMRARRPRPLAGQRLTVAA